MVVLTIVAKNNGETLQFAEPFEKASFMKLHSCSLYNSWKNLSTWGTVRTSGQTKDYDLLSVPSGHHTHETLVDYFNQDKNKAEIAAYTINGGIYFVCKTHKVQFINGFVGLFSSATTTNQKTWFFGGLKKNSYFIYCNLIDKEENFFNTKNQIFWLSLTSEESHMKKFFIKPAMKSLFVNVQPVSFLTQLISITVKDEDGGLFDFNGMPLEFQLEIK